MKYKIEKLPGRGYGVIAAKCFQPGDLIMRDHPLIVMPAKVFENDDPDYIERWLDKKINRLSSSDREKYYDLSDARSSDFDELSISPCQTSLGIFNTNCMTFIDDSAALFPTMARVNHSCSPNAEFFPNSKQYAQDLVATGTIIEGEEITITYLHADEENSEEKKIRQWYLKRWYGFTCQCKTCSLEGDLLQSDDNLRKSIKILQTQDLKDLTLIELDELVDKLRITHSKLKYLKEVLEIALEKAVQENDLVLSAKFFAEHELIDTIIKKDVDDYQDESEKSISSQNKPELKIVEIDYCNFLFSIS